MKKKKHFLSDKSIFIDFLSIFAQLNKIGAEFNLITFGISRFPIRCLES